MGGAIASLRHGPDDILRPMPAGGTDPLEAGCFPLVPYANRIAEGRFAFAGEAHKLRRNFGDHPHSLHGVGWQRPWQVIEAGEACAVLRLDHDGGPDWPWVFAATQEIALGAGGLTATLRIENRDTRPMPAGLGFHPYFPLHATTRLRFTAETLWLAGESLLPTEPVPADRFGDWAAGAAVAGASLIDNAYAGWDGRTKIIDGDRRLIIEAEGASWLHLYRPPDAGFFCVEPVSHMPDALNRDAPMTVLAPGAASRIAMRIQLA